MKLETEPYNIKPAENDQVVIDLAMRIWSDERHLKQIIESLVPRQPIIDTIEAYFEVSKSILIELGFTKFGPPYCPEDPEMAFNLIRMKIQGDLSSLDDDKSRLYLRQNNIHSYSKRKMTWDEAVHFMTYAEGDPKLQQVLRTYNYQKGSTEAESLILDSQAYKYRWYHGLARVSESSISTCIRFLAEYYRDLGPDVRTFSSGGMLDSGSIPFKLDFSW